MTIAGRSSAVAAAINTPGVIAALEMSPPSNPHATTDLSQLWLKIFWDGETTPSVDAPLSLFFATGDAARVSQSILVGSEPGAKFYCYFPMPFWQSARLELHNNGTQPVSTEVNVTYRTSGMPSYSRQTDGYFKCHYNAENPTRSRRDYNFISTGGRGSLVGIVLDMSGANFLNFEGYMEGDERVYVDFNNTPSIHGNGTEDTFNGAYYFLNGTFSRETHGAPFRFVSANKNRRVAYRLMMGDLVPFAAHARFGVEVGGLRICSATIAPSFSITISRSRLSNSRMRSTSATPRRKRRTVSRPTDSDSGRRRFPTRAISTTSS